MITKNGKNAMKFYTNSVYLQPSNPEVSQQSINQGDRRSPEYIKILLGSGDTTPTDSDIKLEEEISTLTTISSYTPSSNAYEDNYIVTSSITVKNNTNENIVVKEMGIVNIRYLSTYNYYFLYAREVLETPITIEPNQTKSFSMTLS